MSAIRLGTATNVRGFVELVIALSTRHVDHTLDLDALQDEFGRFRVWSGNLGALAKGHSSLDYRLRDSPLLATNVLKLLQELQDNLTSSFAIVSGARLPYEQQSKPEKADEDKEEEDDNDDGFFSEDEDDASDNGAPRTELDMRFREIVDILDNLYKLSVRIRAPTIRSRSLKAASYQPKDPETGVDILEQYTTLDLQHTKELVKHLRLPHVQEGDTQEDNDILVNRLARAVTMRRRQFKYWKRHRDKLGVFAAVEEPHVPLPVARPEILHRFDTLEVLPGVPVDLVIKEAPSQKTGKTLLSGTEATHHHQSLDDIVDSKSVTSYATTVRDLTGKGIDLPPPPKAADGERDFECPYCFIICPARYGKGRPWRTHVLQDLQPYVCTYLDCELPDQLFRSRREWAQHEASHRKVWRCPEHPDAVYKSQAGLRDHLLQNHGDSFPESQLDSIVKVGETSTVDLRQCPICYASTDTEGVGEIQNHISNHLERIAAFALPVDVDDDSDGASSRASRGRSDSTESQNLSEVSFASNSSDAAEEIKHNTELDDGIPSSESKMSLSSSGINELPPGQGLLSEEFVRDLPDATQDKMSLLLSSQLDGNPDPNETATDEAPKETPTEEAEQPADPDVIDVKAFTQYANTLPGVELVHVSEHNSLFRGYIRFKDEALATVAIRLFDHNRYPNLTLNQQKSTLVLASLQQGGADEKPLQEPHTRLEQSESQTMSPISTSSIEDDQEEQGDQEKQEDGEEQEDRWPILPWDHFPSIRQQYRSGQLLQRDQSFAANDAYNQIISFCSYSLTRISVDAIINSANRDLKSTPFSSTLNNTIHKAAGPELREECKRIGRIKSGHAAITKGYKLPCAHIIHVARRSYSNANSKDRLDLLGECYRRALTIAMNHGLQHLAIPLLGAGGCGFPPRAAARIALQEVRKFLDSHPDYSISRIREETAYTDFIPIFFPPTHGDMENGEQSQSRRNRALLGVKLLDAHDQAQVVVDELINYREQVPDFDSCDRVIDHLMDIIAALSSLKKTFSSDEPINNFKGRTIADLEQLCTVVKVVCDSITEVVELAKGKASIGQPSYKAIWEDYNSHMKNYQGLDLDSLLEICQDFAHCLDNILVWDYSVPHEMGTMSIRIGSWLLKQNGQGEQSVQDRFEEVMLTRQFQRDAIVPRHTDVIKLAQVPSIAQLYWSGELEEKPSQAVPSSRLNDIICLLRDDITRLEVDIIVNSTDPYFSGMGTLDRTVFRKGGADLRSEISNIGRCAEGKVKVTEGYQLPAKHILHAVPPDTYRSNTKDVLREIYRNILHTAVSLNATSIAIPTIGTGMLGYPSRDCAWLAMEEIKLFLESMESSSFIEKVIFVVFSENDEYIYKSLLPARFPPVDVNVNRALPAGRFPTSQARNIPTTGDAADAADAQRPTFFGSISEAFRGIRFGKTPAKPMKRPLRIEELNALGDFEGHAQTCSTCSQIDKVYLEGGNLCVEGYSAAQLCLQYLFMEHDRSVYSTNAEGRVKTEVEFSELLYPMCWELLRIVETSFRDKNRTRPFVSANLPWPGPADNQLYAGQPPPGVTIYNTEVIVPVEPERAFAHVDIWSEESKTWEALQPDEASIHIFPGKLKVYEWDHQTQSQPPLLSLELTPLVITAKNNSTNVMIDRARTFHESVVKSSNQIMLKCRTPADREMLFRRLQHAADNNPTHMAHRSVRERSEGRPESISELLPSVPTQDPVDTPRRTRETIPELRELADLRSRMEALTAASATLKSPTSAPALPTPIHVLGERILTRLRALVLPEISLHQSQLATILNEPAADIEEAIQYLHARNLIHPVFGDDKTWVAGPSRRRGEGRRRSPGRYRGARADKGVHWPDSDSEAGFGAGKLSIDIEKPSQDRSSKPVVTAKSSGPALTTLVGARDDRFSYVSPALTGTLPAAYIWTKIHGDAVDARVLQEANEEFEEGDDGLVVHRMMESAEVILYIERTSELRK